MEFYYTLNPESDTPIMLIDRHVGCFFDEGGFGIDGSVFARELYALDGMNKKSIEIWINSVGGSVMDGMSIYNAIINTKTKVNTYNTGVCASIAAVIFQAGRHRSMADYALQMLHNTGAEGASIDVLLKFNDSVATMISSRCGKSKEDVLALMDKTTWYSASESLIEGFCDEVTNSAASNKKRMVAAENNIKDNWKICREITNSALPITTIKNNIDMSTFNLATINNALGLQAEASSESTANAIKALQNRAAVAEQNIEAKDNTINDLKNSIQTLKDTHNSAIDVLKAQNKKDIDAKDQEILDVRNEVKDQVDELTKLKADQLTLLAAQKETSAKELVNGFVKAGKIKNEEEVIKSWVNKAVEDLDGTKVLLESIPGNKVAPVIDYNNQSGGATTGSVIARTMAEIKNKSLKN